LGNFVLTSRKFMQVDVFTSQAYWGNPVAVVLDGTGLSDSAMQRFARWTQLSETTFVLPPSPKGQADGADYRLRIFTPGGELPFAGHPTLGSARAWLEGGGQVQQDGVIIQECGVGLVRIENQEGRWAFAAPPTQKRAVPTDMMAPLLSALGVEAEQVLASQILNNGPEWWCFLLDSAETVQHLNPDHLALKKMGVKVGVAAPSGSPFLIARSNRESRAFSSAAGKSRLQSDAVVLPMDLEVRAFAAAMGILEDPVTGSLNASLAQWLIEEKLMPSHYVAGQGHALGRQGRVHIQQHGSGQVWVGGDTAVCIEGHVALD
jgi:PhzF family phenazine biosynthesis protein